MKTIVKENKSPRRADFLFIGGLILFVAICILPEFFSFQARTRVLTTKANLALIRERIDLFKQHNGRFPNTLQELLEETYPARYQIRNPYLTEIPPEKISTNGGLQYLVNTLSADGIRNRGGWIYQADLGDVRVNVDKKLDRRWGEFKGEVPSQW